MVANLQSKVVTRNDCGTKAGVHLPIDDHNVIDRYLAADQLGLDDDAQVEIAQEPPLHHRLHLRELRGVDREVLAPLWLLFGRAAVRGKDAELG